MALPSRLELLHPGAYQPKLQLSAEMAVPPQEGTSPERVEAARAWQAMQGGLDDAVRDRRELDKLDRAVLAARRQTHAARQELQDARAQLAVLRNESYPAPLFWGCAVLAVAAAAGWVHQRRQLLVLRTRGVDPEADRRVAPAARQEVPRAVPAAASPGKAAEPASTHADVQVPAEEPGMAGPSSAVHARRPRLRPSPSPPQPALRATAGDSRFPETQADSGSLPPLDAAGRAALPDPALLLEPPPRPPRRIRDREA